VVKKRTVSFSHPDQKEEKKEIHFRGNCGNLYIHGAVNGKKKKISQEIFKDLLLEAPRNGCRGKGAWLSQQQRDRFLGKKTEQNQVEKGR